MIPNNSVPPKNTLEMNSGPINIRVQIIFLEVIHESLVSSYNS